MSNPQILIPVRARPLRADLRDVIREAVGVHGVRAVADAIDCSRQTLLAGLAGVDIRLEVVERMEAGTEALAQAFADSRAAS